MARRHERPGPAPLAPAERHRPLASRCELRHDFRSFRLGRMSGLDVLHERFRPEVGKTIQDFLKRDAE